MVWHEMGIKRDYAILGQSPITDKIKKVIRFEPIESAVKVV